MSKTITLKSNPIVSTLAYAANECVGGLIEVEGANRLHRSAFLFNLRLLSRINVQAEFAVHLFESRPTGTFTDQSAMVLADFDYGILIDRIPIVAADYVLVTGNGYIARPTIQDPINLNLESTSLWVALKCIGTPTFSSASALTLRFGIEID
jgi:hypothetical protein